MFNDLLQLPLYTAPITNNAIDITYAHHGSGDLLVLVHGSLCDLRYWRWQLNKLHTDCQVVALSLPGYWPNNTSFTPNTFDFNLHVAALSGVIESLRQPRQKLHVLGHSRGAQIAATYAWKNLKKIDSLILADAAFTVDQSTPSLAVLQTASELLMQGEDEKALGLFIDAVNGSNTWKRMVGWFKAMVEDNANTLIEQSQETLPIVTQTHIQLLSQIPVLLINGKNSPQRYQSSAQGLIKALPQAQHVIIDKASHGMNLANPRAFNSAIVDFLNQKNVL